MFVKNFAELGKLEIAVCSVGLHYVVKESTKFSNVYSTVQLVVLISGTVWQCLSVVRLHFNDVTSRTGANFTATGRQEAREDDNKNVRPRMIDGSDNTTLSKNMRYPC